MVELQDQSLRSAVSGVMASLSDRMRVRRPPEKRARIKHGQITMAQAENAKEAWLFSIRNGAALNTFATVHWGHAPAKRADLHPVDRNGLLRDGLKAWFYRHAPGVPFAWIEVREKTRALGEHVHLVAHVPDHLRERFAKAVDRPQKGTVLALKIADQMAEGADSGQGRSYRSRGLHAPDRPAPDPATLHTRRV